jgi:hypothetical protein
MNKAEGIMMQGSIEIQLKNSGAMQLADFGELQARYQALSLSTRAAAVLKDAEPALQTAEQMLAALANHPKTRHIFDNIRKNQALMGKMRPSEAKNMLLDGSNDFIDVTRKKLSAWRKTMERIGQGEGVITEKSREYISSQVPLAMALASVATVSSYLSIVQVALGELSKIDSKNAFQHNSMLAKIRRCATLLSDCENAASFTTVVH